MNKIQGYGSSYNYNSLNFTGFRKPKKDDADKFIFLDQHLLDYGIPEKVAFVKDHDYAFYTVMLFDENNDCFYSEEMPDEDAFDAEKLFRQNGVKEFIELEDIKGGQYGKPKERKAKNGKNTFELHQLSAKDRATVLNALYELSQREKAAKTVLKSPVVLRHPEYRHPMGYYSFLAETYESDFNIDDVLNNLNVSTKGGFEPDFIDKITVSEDGTLMRIQTTDDKKAALDFNNGRRTVYENGNISIMDNNGPIIDKRHSLSKSKSM